MSTPHHKGLTDTLQKFHDDLRQNYQNSDNWTASWEAHKSQSENLQIYAKAMHELATQVWDKQNPVDYSRIDWVVQKSLEYFPSVSTEKRKLKLLDVGSCYNPFKKFEFFEVDAIDLCPAPGFENEIIKGDFLNLKGKDFEIENGQRETNNSQSILSIKPPYDIVVFSFFLEYLPSKEQRKEATAITVELLKPGGLLFILRPDSNPAGQVNSRLIKQLKVGAGLLGLKRINLEKLPHLWCMAFVKLSEEEFECFKLSKRFLKDVEKVACSDENEYFAIAQDLKQFSTDTSQNQITVEPELFLELPGEINVNVI